MGTSLRKAWCRNNGRVCHQAPHVWTRARHHPRPWLSGFTLLCVTISRLFRSVPWPLSSLHAIGSQAQSCHSVRPPVSRADLSHPRCDAPLDVLQVLTLCQAQAPVLIHCLVVNPSSSMTSFNLTTVSHKDSLSSASTSSSDSNSSKDEAAGRNRDV